MPTARTKSKPTRAKSSANATPLDSERHALRSQESKVAQEIAALQREIKDAPRRRAEELRRERESLLTGAVQTGYHRHSALLDPRFSAEPATALARRPRPARMLRAEQDAARRKAFALLVALGVIALWAASHFLG